MDINTPALKLQIDGIHKRFGANEVLRGVSLQAAAGDVIAIIGSSGSGKSTLLRCINLLEKPNAGSITVAGETLALVPDKSGELVATGPAATATPAHPPGHGVPAFQFVGPYDGAAKHH